MGLEMWIQALVGGIIGLLLMPLGSLVTEMLNSLKQPDLRGEWLSTWELKDGTTNWANETINIEKKFGKHKFFSKENDCGFIYSGYFSFSSGNILIAEMSSKRKGAITKGNGILYIQNQGLCLYGYSFAPNIDGKHVIRKWVLGKTLEDLELGKRLYNG